jgi:hypothetical protein
LYGEDFSNSSTIEFTTPTSSPVINTPAHKPSKQNDRKVANDLIEVAQDIASKIKPQNEKSNTDNAFGQYVAERLQEMGVVQRSAKRRAIVLLLENIYVIN